MSISSIISRHVKKARPFINRTVKLGYNQLYAFFYYLPWLVDVYGKSYYFENATQCGKRMLQLGFKLTFRTKKVELNSLVVTEFDCTGRPRYSRTQYSRVRLFAIELLILNFSIRGFFYFLTHLFAVFL